jgi:hypothetical protein
VAGSLGADGVTETQLPDPCSYFAAAVHLVGGEPASRHSGFQSVGHHPCRLLGLGGEGDLVRDADRLAPLVDGCPVGPEINRARSMITRIVGVTAARCTESPPRIPSPTSVKYFS